MSNSHQRYNRFKCCAAKCTLKVAYWCFSTSNLAQRKPKQKACLISLSGFRHCLVGVNRA